MIPSAQMVTVLTVTGESSLRRTTPSRLTPIALAVMVTTALLACGGGDATRVGSAGSREHAQAFETPVATLNASSAGAWSTVANWPLVAIHMVVLPDGRVM